jgi:hypothetical protein
MVEKRAKSKRRVLLMMMLNKEQRRKKMHKDRLLRLSRELKLLKLRKLKTGLRRKGVDKRKNVARRRLLSAKSRIVLIRKTMREIDLCSNKWRTKGNRKWRGSTWSSRWPRKKLKDNSNRQLSEMVMKMRKNRSNALTSKTMMKLT